MMDSSAGYPDSPIEQDDATYPCKGCGEILDEGKAFELAGSRWHIDCFRCNTCSTLLDSDANLLLLGDGSLICNNCTYSCSACGNKIEDLAILTGDQAYCASCFRCRNCKKKIENLKYARTTQGIFCMDCHDSLMHRRRKKTARHGSTRQKHSLQQQSSSNTMLLHKSLPSLPPNALDSESTLQSILSPENESSPSDGYSNTPTELPHLSHKRPTASRSHSHNETLPEQSLAPTKRPPNSRSSSSRSRHKEKVVPAPEEERTQGTSAARPTLTMQQHSLQEAENLILPTTKYDNRRSTASRRSDGSGNGEDFFIPMALDPNVLPGLSPMMINEQFNGPSAEKENIKPPPRSGSRDYFSVKGNAKQRTASHEHQTNHAPSHPDSPRDSGHSSRTSSPHIAYQAKGRDLSMDTQETVRKRKENGTGSALAAVANEHARGESARPSRTQSLNGDPRNGKFQLQEVPKSKKSAASTRNSLSEPTSISETMGSTISRSASNPANSPLNEQHVMIPSTDSPASLRPEPSNSNSPRMGQEGKLVENGTKASSTSQSTAASTHIQYPPQRGDSLLKLGDANIKKESAAAAFASKPLTLKDTESEDKPLSAPPINGNLYPDTSSPVNGTRIISKPTDIPVVNDGGLLNDFFVAPRQSPYPPMGDHHKQRNESVSTLKSESTNTGENLASPKRLPPYSGGQEFTMDEDMARILGSEEHSSHDSFLRRFSNSVRHARSYSDRGTHLSKEQKWPRSPLTASSGFVHGISSPASSSPESKEELAFFKNELRRERQKSVEREQRLHELEAALEAKSSITQMNTELKEKRSTMVVLDTQKEIVVRELEVLTEHIAGAKKTREPLDLNKMSNAVLREFAESLQKLKASFTPQVEDLAQKRNELIEEVSNLTQLKDRSFQEFEQLSSKNAQLAELNNTLVHQVQQLYKANASPSLDIVRPPPNGLGIYNHNRKDPSTASFDIRDMRPSIADSNTTSATLVQEQDAEPAAYVSAPQVVNIRKGQPKKFNWKKGGHNVAKVTKGLKGAFSSNDGPKPQREGQYTEGVPYNQMVQGPNYPTTEPPRNHHHDPARQGFGFFSDRRGKPPLRTTPNGSGPAVNQSIGVPLFGSELQHRAEHEASDVPSIVMRCIQEVEIRGMELEGIYRKSGGNSQIQQIKEGFERTNDYDISDPDLDINAVTSTLKQYFRKLPTPLITYDVYDKLLDSAPPVYANSGGPPQTNPNHNLDPEQREQRVQSMRQAIGALPSIHRACLEFLIFHLARVVEHERSNLMTSLNVAVVFAPTVMRPESLAREMSESQAKNQAVQFLIENCQGIFQGEKAAKDEW
ncbi:MAG: hypothetical protein Q9196_001293 [Gyalolechia fulgens]